MSVKICSCNRGVHKLEASGESLGMLSLGFTSGSLGLFSKDGSKLSGIKTLDIHAPCDSKVIVTVELLVAANFFEDKK